MDDKDVISAVEAIAAMMGKIPHSKVKAAAKAVKVAAPVAGIAAQAAPAAAKAVGPVAAKAGHAVAGAAGAAKGKIANAVGGGAQKVKEKAKAVASDKQQKALRADARKRLLQCAPVYIDAVDIGDSTGNGSGALVHKFAHFPGCYAAVTYGGKIKEKNLEEYREVRVFYAEDMGSAIRVDVAGGGDIDIYADVKYDQNVRFYLFPCSEEDSRELLPSLVEVLVDNADDDGAHVHHS